MRCGDAAQELSPPYAHHLAGDIGSVLLHLFEMSLPEAKDEPEPETPEGTACAFIKACTAPNWIAEALWD